MSANQIKWFKHFTNGWLLTTLIQIFRGISQFFIAVRVHTVTRLWAMASSDRSDDTDDSSITNNSSDEAGGNAGGVGDSAIVYPSNYDGN